MWPRNKTIFPIFHIFYVNKIIILRIPSFLLLSSEKLPSYRFSKREKYQKKSSTQHVVCLVERKRREKTVGSCCLQFGEYVARSVSVYNKVDVQQHKLFACSRLQACRRMEKIVWVCGKVDGWMGCSSNVGNQHHLRTADQHQLLCANIFTPR